MPQCLYETGNSPEQGNISLKYFPTLLNIKLLFILIQKVFRNFVFVQSASAHNVSSKYVPRRALMYVPGDDNRKLRKSLQLDVDCIALDCEDGVAISRKQIARESIRAFFESELNVSSYDSKDMHRKSEWSVRLNSVDSELCEEDLKVIVSGERVPETLLLPKCESPADLKVVR